MAAAEIPIIDFGCFMHPEAASDAERAAVAQAVDAALQSNGVFIAANVGVTDAASAGAFEAARRFFSLPIEQKRAADAVKQGGFIRGYLGYGAESGRKELFEPKEGFSYGYPWPEDRPPTNALQGPNRWPSAELVGEGWRPSMEGTFDVMVRCAEAFVDAIALALGQDKQELRSYCEGGDTISLLRLFYYHAADPEHPNSIGSSPHTDWGFLTVILQDAVGGLQFLSNGEWKDVPCVPNSMIVNCGDYLSLLSGGRYKSPIHRVLCPPVDRVSYVFFYYPSYDARLDMSQWTPTSHEYNTLMDSDAAALQQDADSAKELKFGDYISRKWVGVQKY